MLKRLLAIISILYSSGSIAQSFTIEGTINADTGTIELRPLPDTSYYPGHDGVLITSIKQGHFVFRGSSDHPRAFVVRLSPNYISDMFFVDPGTQSLSCNVDSVRKVPAISNITMEELKDYTAAFDSWNVAFSHLRNKAERDSMRNEQRIVLLGYARKHRDSFVAFWETAVAFYGNGYRPIYDSIYDQFSETLKDTYEGRVFAGNLRSARVTAIGEKLPLLRLVNTHDGPVTVPETDQPFKYVLVDFWYSHCDACIGQFPDLKKIYADYNAKGFKVIAVSTDGPAFVSTTKDWKAAVKAQALPWPQYLDANGKWADQLGVHAFPSNFLLDAGGVILKKNISPDELRRFLSTATY